MKAVDSGYFNYIFNALGESFIIIIVWVALAFLITQLVFFYNKDKLVFAIQNNKKTEIIFSAFLGYIPGCGGTIFLIPLYKKHTISLGALVASFITTLGEITFILLFLNPMAFLLISGITLLVGIITGYLVNLFKLEEKLKLNKHEVKKEKIQSPTSIKKEKKVISTTSIKWFEKFDKLILPTMLAIILLAILPLTIVTIFTPSPDTTFGNWYSNYVLVANSLAILVLVIFVPYKLYRDYFTKKIIDIHDHTFGHTLHSNEDTQNSDFVVHKHHDGKKGEITHELRHVFITVLFIIFWVFISTIIIDSFVYLFLGLGTNETVNFAVNQNVGYRFLILFIVLLISMIPVCGPQIFVVILFGNGAIAFSSLMANSISQNGHAGLAMLSVDKKSYNWMKNIILIPAILVGIIFIIIEITTPLNTWILHYNIS